MSDSFHPCLQREMRLHFWQFALRQNLDMLVIHDNKLTEIEVVVEDVVVGTEEVPKVTKQHLTKTGDSRTQTKLTNWVTSNKAARPLPYFVAPSHRAQNIDPQQELIDRLSRYSVTNQVVYPSMSALARLYNIGETSFLVELPPSEIHGIVGDWLAKTKSARELWGSGAMEPTFPREIEWSDALKRDAAVWENIIGDSRDPRSDQHLTSHVMLHTDWFLCLLEKDVEAHVAFLDIHKNKIEKLWRTHVSGKDPSEIDTGMWRAIMSPNCRVCIPLVQAGKGLETRTVYVALQPTFASVLKPTLDFVTSLHFAADGTPWESNIQTTTEEWSGPVERAGIDFDSTCPSVMLVANLHIPHMHSSFSGHAAGLGDATAAGSASQWGKKIRELLGVPLMISPWNKFASTEEGGVGMSAVGELAGNVPLWARDFCESTAEAEHAGGCQQENLLTVCLPLDPKYNRLLRRDQNGNHASHIWSQFRQGTGFTGNIVDGFETIANVALVRQSADHTGLRVGVGSLFFSKTDRWMLTSNSFGCTRPRAVGQNSEENVDFADVEFLKELIVVDRVPEMHPKVHVDRLFQWPLPQQLASVIKKFAPGAHRPWSGLFAAHTHKTNTHTSHVHTPEGTHTAPSMPGSLLALTGGTPFATMPSAAAGGVNPQYMPPPLFTEQSPSSQQFSSQTQITTQTLPGVPVSTLTPQDYPTHTAVHLSQEVLGTEPHEEGREGGKIRRTSQTHGATSGRHVALQETRTIGMLTRLRSRSMSVQSDSEFAGRGDPSLGARTGPQSASEGVRTGGGQGQLERVEEEGQLEESEHEHSDMEHDE